MSLLQQARFRSIIYIYICMYVYKLLHGAVLGILINGLTKKGITLHSAYPFLHFLLVCVECRV
jgi:hypothetical protein